MNNLNLMHKIILEKNLNDIELIHKKFKYSFVFNQLIFNIAFAPHNKLFYNFKFQIFRYKLN